MKKLLISFLFMVLISVSILGVVNATTTTEPLVQASFSTNPITATPGSDGYITMTLDNTGGGNANSVKVTITSIESGITIDNYRFVDVGGIAAGESNLALFKFSVPKDTPSGLYRLNFEIDYCQVTSCRDTNQFAIIRVQAPTVLELTSIEPSSLNAGETSKVIFKLFNNGKDEIDNIILTWQASSDLILSMGSDNRVFISSIGAGQSVEVPVNVIVSPTITPDLYSLTIRMEYYDQAGVKQNVTSTAGMMISSVTDFDVSMQSSTSGSTTFAIANIGTYTAYSVIMNIPQQQNFRVAGTSSSVIGNLNAGDYTLATFQITSMNNTEIPSNFTARGQRVVGENTSTMNVSNITMGKGNLIVDISYTDSLGVRHTIQKEVALSSLSAGNTFGISGISGQTQRSQTQSSKSNSLIYIIVGIVGIVILIGVILFFKFRKKIRRKNNK